MEVSVETATRRVIQYGLSLGARNGCVVEDIDDATFARIAVAQAQPNEGVVLSADHQTVTAFPLSAETLAAQTATAAHAARLAQHTTALAALKPALLGNATTTTNDIAAVSALITAVEAGTAVTAAQVEQVLRFVLRTLVVLHADDI